MGWEVARILAEKGWKLGIAARREEKLQALQALYPQSIECQVIDIEQENAPDLLLSLIEKTGGIDLYFHGSGVGWHNEELDPSVELKTCAVNTVGFTRMVTAAWNYFKENGGGHIAVNCRNERPRPSTFIFRHKELRQYLYPGACTVIAEIKVRYQVHRHKAWLCGHSASGYNQVSLSNADEAR